MTLFDRPYPFVHALGGLRRHLLFQPVAGGVQASDGDRHLVGDLPVAQVHLDQHAKRFLRRRDPRPRSLSVGRKPGYDARNDRWNDPFPFRSGSAGRHEASRCSFRIGHSAA